LRSFVNIAKMRLKNFQTRGFRGCDFVALNASVREFWGSGKIWGALAGNAAPPVGWGGVGDASGRTDGIREVSCLLCPQLYCCAQIVSRSAILHHRQSILPQPIVRVNPIFVANSVTVAGFATAANFAVVTHRHASQLSIPSLQPKPEPATRLFSREFRVNTVKWEQKSCALSGKANWAGFERAEKALFYGSGWELNPPTAFWAVHRI
jgi:hypothetical protein